LNEPSTLRPWFTFFGCVLVVAILYWAQDVLVPVALALLITFVLTTPVAWLQRRIGRVPAVLAAVVLAFAGLGLAGWGVWLQMSSLARDLPAYRVNIRQKIADVRGAGRGGSVEKIQKTIDDVQAEIADSDTRSKPPPVLIGAHAVTAVWGLPSWLGPLVGPLSATGFVLVLVIFMLLEQNELRDRLISLVGRGNLKVTTQAFDEAGVLVTRQLLMQSLVNVLFGIVVAAGLYALGVPYALLWGVAAAPLRFVPYLGPLVAASAPILMSLASARGWGQPLLVIGLFVLLELFTNLVLETVLYAGAAGVSQVALLIAVAFWTWLWGLPGLLMAMPLTVCLVVLGKHVPGLEFIATLLAERSPVTPHEAVYRRLLDGDRGEAADLPEDDAAAKQAS
jgi:predicted PurR-regulated permease PerM